MLLLLGARAVAASFDCAAARPQGPPCYPSHSGPHRIRRRLALKYRLAELKDVAGFYERELPGLLERCELPRSAREEMRQ